MRRNGNNLQYHVDKRTPFTIGEIYRCILAHLTDKEIKKALLKYRDLMPQNSDWNRKLTQATDVPEIGFRYLYRCGQIDETNHKTMQKMLKYVDRQDVLPFFETLLYDSALENKNLPYLKAFLTDTHLALLRLLSHTPKYQQVFSEPYILKRLPAPTSRRVTRSWTKRQYSFSSVPDTLTALLSLPLDKRPRLEGMATLSGDSSFSLTGPSTPRGKDLNLRHQAPWLFTDWSSAEDMCLYKGVDHLINQLFCDSCPDDFGQATIHPAIKRCNDLPITDPITPVTPFCQFATNHASLCIRVKTDMCNFRMMLLNTFTHLNQEWDAQLEIYKDTQNLLIERQSNTPSCTVHFSRLDHLDLFWSYYLRGHLENGLYKLLLKPHMKRVLKQAKQAIKQEYLPSDTAAFHSSQLLSSYASRGSPLKVYIQQEEYENARCVLLNKMRRQWAEELNYFDDPPVSPPDSSQEKMDIPTESHSETPLFAEVDDSVSTTNPTFVSPNFKEVPLNGQLDDYVNLYSLRKLTDPWFTKEVLEERLDDKAAFWLSMNPLYEGEEDDLTNHAFLGK